MDNNGFNVERLIHPLALNTFFDEYWERKPVHVQRNDRDYYAELLCHQDLDNLITNSDMRYPALKLVPKGAGGHYRPDMYTTNLRHGNDTFNGEPDLEKVIQEYRSGTTVVLPSLERTWQPIRRLCLMLEAYFNHAARANVYITKDNSQGFSPHYDTHEVFVLQIAGSKHWSVYDAPLPLPLVSQPFYAQPFSADTELPQPLLECNLEQGDLLYIPRGYLHQAYTSSEFSVHVTVGITVYTWVDLAAELFMSSMENPRFRRALPPGFADNPDLREALRNGMGELLSELSANCDYDRLIDKFTQKVSSNRLKPKGTFRCDLSS